MGLSGKVGAVVLSLSLSTAGAGVAMAGDKSPSRADYRKVQFAHVSGDGVDGLVAAGKIRGERQVHVYASIHGLPREGGEREYDLVASQEPCRVDGADFLAWRTSIIMANTEGDFAVAKDVPLEARFRSAKSIRIYDLTDPEQPKEEACGPATRR
jgi:hypothetical protein